MNALQLAQRRSAAEAVAREKMIDPDLVIQAMEDSLSRAAKSRYGAERDIRVNIDRKTGRPVMDLTERDFIVTENGDRQDITTFARESLLAELLPAGAPRSVVLDRPRPRPNKSPCRCRCGRAAAPQHRLALPG